MDCVFCKIASGKIKADKVYENDDLVVIKDISPQAPVHLLVIPKKHYSTILDCADDARLLGEMCSAAVRAAKKAGVGEKGFRISLNTNDEGGQTVFHLHMHILGGRQLTGRLG
ncbi:MAG: histidine triad nucleotide-binding protein [Deltaproteobacteria bacterium]|nr:histidine triad nucleotide-binding protein [Deltaproteobacteria bacterium]